ncbi:MAG TPA: hypothetical protein VL098_03240 [Flavipsychrobacter sp.]|nr:hypothetical protein [Flavipsychrobacter sp.]
MVSYSCNKEPRSSGNPAVNDTSKQDFSDTLSANYTLLDSLYSRTRSYKDSTGIFQTFSNRISSLLHGTVNLLRVTDSATDVISVFEETFLSFDASGSYISRNPKRQAK